MSADLNNLTDRARKVMRRAGEHAEQLGHHYIGTEHILLALVDVDGIAAHALKELGLTPEIVRNEVMVILDLSAEET